jgi:hypothetical protein
LSLFAKYNRIIKWGRITRKGHLERME